MKSKHIKTNSHKRGQVYANPTIAEALCEIHFYSKTDYDNSKLQTLKNALQSNYPNVTEQRIKQYHATVNESGISVDAEKHSVRRWIFKHNERNHLIQIHPGVLTINEVRVYPGWEKFQEDVFNGWTAINEAFPIVNVKRIGLRYINLIPRKDPNEPLSVWLNTNQYYPNAILDNTRGFQTRSEFYLKENQRLIVNISEQTETSNGIIFDLDVISSVERDNDWTVLSDILNGLHATLSDVFFNSLTKKYMDFLEGKL